MSDLQCPARILVARHGEAADEHPGTPSDEGGRLTDRGRRQAAALARRLTDERVAAVYTSRLDRARQTGEVVAEALGIRVSVVDGLQELSGGETGEEVAGRFVAAVEELADRHRGETVLVVTHGGVMTLAVPTAASDLTPRTMLDASILHCGVAEVAVDGDGWTLVGPWPGHRGHTPAGTAGRDSEEPRADVVDAP